MRLVIALGLIGSLSLGGVPAAAQSITSPNTAKTLAPWDDYATQQLRDAWDMRERTDIGWFTWGVDQPVSNLTNKRMTVDGFGQTIFSGTPSLTVPDPSIFLVDPYSPETARRFRNAAEHRIDTSRYTRLLVKMRLGTEIKPPQFPGTVPVMQIYWSRDTIYFDPTARPTGGTYTTVDVNGNQVGVPFSPLTSEPYGAMEGGHYVIFSVPLTIGGLQALNSNIAKWKNVNANNPSVDVNWGTSSAITADSLRFKPVNLKGNQSGAVDIDWARLVAPGADAPESVTWTGGGSYDIVISTATDCGASNGNYAVLAYHRTSGYQFNPQALPNGKYYVGLRDQITANGPDTPGSRAIRACSNSSGGSYTVLDYPDLAFTKPNPTGSADDFATVFLGNPWDFVPGGDLDRTNNISQLWPALVPTERPDGTSLGNVAMLFGTSTAVQGPGGDPYVYTLFSTARGLNNRIDTNRYRLLTLDMGVDHDRDLMRGSVLRLVWHIASETWFTNGGTYDAENVSADITLHHLRKSTATFDTQSSSYVLDHIQFDLGDRYRLPLESDTNGSPSRTGWSNTALQCGGAGCSTWRIEPFDREGVDNFRFDPHEFPEATNFFLQQAKLAAHERTGSSYTITWSSVMPAVPTSGTYANPASWKVRLYAVRTQPESHPGAGDGSPSTPAVTDCSANPGLNSFFITPVGAEPTLASGSYQWNAAGTGGLVSGGLYFVCAGLLMPGSNTPAGFTFSEWPVVYDPAAGAALPRLVVSRTSLSMSARHTGANNPPNLSSKTPPQTVTLTQVGGGAAAGWYVEACLNYNPSAPQSCTGTVDFLQISQTSGWGSGSFTVQLKDSSQLPVSTGSTPVTAVLRIREASAGTLANSPQYVQICITIYPPSQPASTPFGMVDAPAQGASGQVGAIAVSGWALDDIGVQRVSIYRNCLGFDAPGACQTVGGHSVVFVGDASFIDGARPDVQAAYPSMPLSSRAGWGYLLLTNMLPHVPNQQAFGGQGSVALYAFAVDQEGGVTLLGRSPADHTPTTVSLDNDHIAKPFGSIDTPAQGGAASGSNFANFGWTLTPDTGTGVLVPTNGSTITVYIDGTASGHPVYNQCRGSVGNPPPPGVYCNDDVASIFGSVPPQPPGAQRISNPSKFRNLDAARGAIGAFIFNMSGLTPGLHTISWSVTDTLGRAEGIGSRFFNVPSGGAPPAPLPEADAADLGELATSLDVLEPVTVPVGVRLGWDEDAALAWATQRAGAIRVAADPLDRLELELPHTLSGSTWQGYGVDADRLMLLPAGSTLNRDGTFVWQTAAGYFGDHDLLFVRTNADGRRETLPVRVTIAPGPASASAPSPSASPSSGSSDQR